MSTTGIKNGRMSSTRSGLSATEYKSAIDGVPGAALAPVGTILPFGGPTAPIGWMLCDGSAVSRTTYAALFAAMGGPSAPAWGYGDNSTTFNIPDLRGYTLRGRDGGVGRDPDRAARTAIALGGNTGDNVGSAQADAYTTHTHGITSWAGSFGAGGTPIACQYSRNSTTTSDGPSGGNTSSETRMKNANVNYIVKY